ncbi:MAG TPA: tRNA (guanosine(46)-N7)-methyltransferase TrmB, partial [Methylotenera sp.]|nr:tRNA (guanosine(46)-N7)-methyltransferase TrmB [Methylotenera sp.]
MNEINSTEDIQIDTTEANDLSQRRIRSFVLRQGRLTKGQARALETVFPKFGIT